MKIQILIHHFKIPSRIEICLLNDGGIVSKLGSILNNIRFRYLFFNLKVTPSEGKSYTERELKSINVDVVVNGLQLTFHRCFINHLNIYNQVGLVAFSLLGSPCEPALFENPMVIKYLD
jgi:hypothetical protein